MTIEELRVIISAKTEKLQEGINKATSRIRDFKKTSDDMESTTARNINKMKSQYDSLVKKLDNVNARAELQQRKLNDLREKYSKYSGIRADSPKAIKLQEQILNAENRLQNLIHTSDKTVNSIHDLEEKMKNASDSIKVTSSRFERLKEKLEQIRNRFKQTADSAEKSNQRISKSTNVIARSLMTVLRRLFIYNLIYKAIRGLISYMDGTLKTNNQFVSSLNTIKTNLRVAFQPIYDFILPAIQALMRALATLTTYIASFTSALFGKTYKQSYDAAKGIESAKKAMDGYGSSAKRARGQVASFDEVNLLDVGEDKDGGGDSSFEMGMPNLTEIDEWPITKLQQRVAEMFKPFKDAWDNEGQNTINSAKTALNSMKELIETIGNSFKEVWTGGSGQDILESFLKVLQIILGIIGDIADAFRKVWNKDDQGTMLLESIAGAIKNILILIESIGISWREVWNNGTGQEMVKHILGILTQISDLVANIAESFRIAWETNNTGTKILQGIADTLNIILGIFESIGDTLNKVWGEVGQDVANTFMKILESSISILKRVAEGFKEIWDRGGQHLFESLIKLGSKIFEIAGFIYTEFVAPFVMWFIEKISPAIGIVLDWIGYLVDGMVWLLDKFLELIEGIKDGKLGEFFTELWEGIKTKTEEVWSAIAEFFIVLWEGITVALTDAWDAIVEFLVGLWDGLSESATTIWTGIKTFFEETWDNIKTKTSETWDNIKSFLIDKIWTPIKTSAQTIWEGIKKFTLDPMSQAWTKLKEIWDGIKKYVLDKWDEIKTGISNTKDKLVNAIKEPFNIAKNWIDGVIKDAYNWGKNLIGNIIDGIKSMIGKVKDAVKGVADTIGDFLGFHSPSKLGPGKDADRWMPNLMDMLAQGIEDNVYKVSGAVNITAESLRGIDNPNKSLASDIGSAVLGAMQFSNNINTQQPIVMQVILEGREIAKAVYDPLQEEGNRRGNPIIQPL